MCRPFKPFGYLGAGTFFARQIRVPDLRQRQFKCVLPSVVRVLADTVEEQLDRVVWHRDSCGAWQSERTADHKSATTRLSLR